MIKACRATKPEFFANDDLIPEKQTIMYALRQSKKKFPNVVDGSSSTGGRIFVYVKTGASTSSGRRNRRIPIGDLSKLEKFCDEELGTNLDQIISARQL